VAEECIPGELQKKSMVIPKPNDTKSNNHDGISTGKRRMNMI